MTKKREEKCPVEVHGMFTSVDDGTCSRCKKSMRPLKKRKEKHEIGECGAVVHVTKKGDVCAECGKLMKPLKKVGKRAEAEKKVTFRSFDDYLKETYNTPKKLESAAKSFEKMRRKYYEKVGINPARPHRKDRQRVGESTKDFKKRVAQNKYRREWKARWKLKNPRKQAIYSRQQYANRKIKAMKLLGGAFCANCKCDELSFLEFNHKNGGGTKDIKKANYFGTAHRIILGRIPKNEMNVLCRVCNALDFLSRKNKSQEERLSVMWK